MKFRNTVGNIISIILCRNSSKIEDISQEYEENPSQGSLRDYSQIYNSSSIISSQIEKTKHIYSDYLNNLNSIDNIDIIFLKNLEFELNKLIKNLPENNRNIYKSVFSKLQDEFKINLCIKYNLNKINMESKYKSLFLNYINDKKVPI
jgi:hypothetical protein